MLKHYLGFTNSIYIFRQLLWTYKMNPIALFNRLGYWWRESIDDSRPLPGCNALWITIWGWRLAQLVQPDQRNTYATWRLITFNPSNDLLLSFTTTGYSFVSVCFLDLLPRCVVGRLQIHFLTKCSFQTENITLAPLSCYIVHDWSL